MNSYLARDEAPIKPETWEMLDRVALEVAKSALAGRRILYIQGPYGLGLKVVPLADPDTEEELISSQIIPLTFIHKSFTLSKRDLAAHERDKVMLDLSQLAKAAMDCARLEDQVIFNGGAGAPGLLTTPGVTTLAFTRWDNVGAAAEDIIKAVEVLDDAGFHGPYSLALPYSRYNLLLRRYETGAVSELEHVRTIVGAGVYKAPALEKNGVLVASNPGVASVIIGQDMTVGFIGPVRDRLEFSISESLAPLIRQPGAVCVLIE